MPSITDIPLHLMEKTNAAGFFQWLFQVPLPDHIRRELTQLWCYHTGADPQLTFAMLNTKTLAAPVVSTQP